MCRSKGMTFDAVQPRATLEFLPDRAARYVGADGDRHDADGRHAAILVAAMWDRPSSN